MLPNSHCRAVIRSMHSTCTPACARRGACMLEAKMRAHVSVLPCPLHILGRAHLQALCSSFAALSSAGAAWSHSCVVLLLYKRKIRAPCGAVHRVHRPGVPTCARSRAQRGRAPSEEAPHSPGRAASRETSTASPAGGSVLSTSSLRSSSSLHPRAQGASPAGLHTLGRPRSMHAKGEGPAHQGFLGP